MCCENQIKFFSINDNISLTYMYNTSSKLAAGPKDKCSKICFDTRGKIPPSIFLQKLCAASAEFA